jgi:hypothetical protein
MGNQVSDNSNEVGNKKTKLLVNMDKTHSKESWFVKDDSSYKGFLSIKSESSEGRSKAEKKDSKETCDEDYTTTETVHLDTKDIKVPTHFEWKEDGHVVYVTGSFCNWGQKFLMNKVNNRFEVDIDLIRGVYQYKYIIDGNWKFSKHHPSCNDGRGNINNIIDTTHYPLPVVKEKNIKFNKGPPETTREMESKNDASKPDVEIYNSLIPTKNDLYVDALLCPTNYKEYYNINHISNQHAIGKEEYFVKEDNPIFYDNSSYRSISVPPHIFLNHLSSAKVNNRKGILFNSSSQRVRNKYCTIIYYKPVN